LTPLTVSPLGRNHLLVTVDSAECHWQMRSGQKRYLCLYSHSQIHTHTHT